MENRKKTLIWYSNTILEWILILNLKQMLGLASNTNRLNEGILLASNLKSTFLVLENAI